MSWSGADSCTVQSTHVLRPATHGKSLVVTTRIDAPMRRALKKVPARNCVATTRGAARSLTSTKLTRVAL